MNMHIGNLAYDTTEDDLKQMFQAFGEVSAVNIVKERATGRSKGFGFVEMPNNSEADKAIKSLNGTRLKDQSIKISQAKPAAGKVRPGSRY